MFQRKLQVLREQEQLPKHVSDELLDLAEAISFYFGNPAPGTRRGEKNVKFNRVMENLEHFDFGRFAPDEIRGDDLDRRIS